MEKTVLIPAEGKKKFKFTGISPEQTEVLKKDRNHLFKVLAAMGGAYIAFDTFKNLTNISREQWDAMMPDQLERFLSPILDNFVDVDETIAECEEEFQNEPEQNADIADVTQKQEGKKETPEKETAEKEIPEETTEPEVIPEEKTEEIIPDSKEIDIREDIVDTFEEMEIDKDLIIDATINEQDFTIDKDMLEYINSNEILADLNEESAEAVIINDDYIATEVIEIEEDLLPEEEAEIIADEEIEWSNEDWAETDEIADIDWADFFDGLYDEDYYYEETEDDQVYEESHHDAYAEEISDYEEDYDDEYIEGYDDGYIDSIDGLEDSNGEFPSENDDTLNFDDIPDNI